jgi:hypothetical protein
MGQILSLSDFRRPKSQIFFNRIELSALLALYSEQVARGDWRDYAIDHLSGIAMFSVFRHAADRPLYGIAKMAGAHAHEYCLFEGDKRLKRSLSLVEIIDRLRREVRPGE